jgi:hypothetical protein
MAADPDNFEDDCRSDDGILSGDDSDDPDEVNALFTSIRNTQSEQRIHNTAGNEPAAVSSSF